MASSPANVNQTQPRRGLRRVGNSSVLSRPAHVLRGRMAKLRMPVVQIKSRPIIGPIESCLPGPAILRFQLILTRLMTESDGLVERAGHLGWRPCSTPSIAATQIVDEHHGFPHQRAKPAARAAAGGPCLRAGRPSPDQNREELSVRCAGVAPSSECHTGAIIQPAGPDTGIA